MPEKSAVAWVNVRKSFDGQEILSGVSLEAAPGGSPGDPRDERVGQDHACSGWSTG